MASQWANNDLTAATAWVQSLPAGAAKDRVLSSASYSIVNNDPAVAIQWVSSIGDEKMRASQLENLASNWLRQDQTAAAQWISSSNLSADVKARLLQQKNR